MSHSSEMDSLTDFQDPMRSSLEKARGQVERRVRGLATVIVNKPLRAMAVAFLSGVVIARLLQKLG